ncbi:hypothetical protein HZU77_006530 [Neisseriaceae bacterium TC5R-5]|nr:hypothetical protein [Neisseriaceae bacterium TC5R-5]
MRVISLIPLAVLAALSVMRVEAQPFTDTPQTFTAHLSCGQASLLAKTSYLNVVDQDRQVLSQKITLTRADRHRMRVLPQEGKRLRQPFLKNVAVLDAMATGWACLQATDGQAYVYVFYACVDSPLRPECAAPSREWVRLFNTDGKLLNAGFPHEGPRTPALMKKLGLGHYLEDGVQLSAIDGK